MSEERSSRPSPLNVAVTLLLWALGVVALVAVATWLMAAAAMSQGER